ncbi:transducin/WD40 repeat-like superfamily protein [Actinidia rufa]|uniref:Transducin/WD40 repeat-like superfamily protein n=1 Tax=Actinidia rufa TaxID=165716 RepID=A0A7J0FBH3_9ERIC|nr:transducin/WD40 repeat-like superfamily protein [Actinidia rufa]
MERNEGRYLLSGASDASVAIYDVQRATDYEGGGLLAKHKSLVTIDKQHEHGHKYAISSAIWYPIDTGLFITGSYDHHINIWDTNTTQMVMNFKMPGKVYRTAMSSLATSHMLIASGTEDVQVRLCDIASGAFSHTLSGHRGKDLNRKTSLDYEKNRWPALFLSGPRIILLRRSAAFDCLGAYLLCSLLRVMGAWFSKWLIMDHLTLNVQRMFLNGVMTVEWSTSSEWVLVTGGCDGAIRFWDIRRAGCFRVLNQSHSQLGRRPPLLQRAATNKDRATAHYGAVIGLKVTGDGMYLLSAGSDSRLRLWDIESSCNTLVNFETVRLQTGKAIQLATTQDSALVFVPCMTSVKVFDVWSGTTVLTFRGHYEHVNCCWYSLQDQELYTGGNDRQILVWSPSKWNADELDEWSKKGKASALDEDNWSD